MADSITTNADFLAYQICIPQDLEALIPEHDPDRDVQWVALHEAAWQYHILPWINRQGIEESDLTSTDNLKRATAIKAYILALETRGNASDKESRDYMRHKQLGCDYDAELHTVSLQTSDDGGQRSGLGTVRISRGS